MDDLGSAKRYLLVAILSACLILSLYLTYRVQTMPAKEVKFVPSYKYSHKASYEYTATLYPSVLYDNRTTLAPGDVPYIPLIHLLNISLKYEFWTDPIFKGPGNLSYTVYSILEAPGGWSKIFLLTPLKTLHFNSSRMAFRELYTFNITSIGELIHKIELETGTWFPYYNLRIVAEVNVSAPAGSDVLRDSFRPMMTVKLAYREGNRLFFEGLSSERSEVVGVYEESELGWIKFARYCSYILSISLIIALTCASIRLHRLSERTASPLQRIIRKHRDVIVESSGLLDRHVSRIIVTVKSLNDLVKISEISLKPIIHEKKSVTRGRTNVKRHVFYVLDGDVKYEYVAEEPTPR